ncbi:hypothetical protein G6L88_17660 [Rhizobium skierniewicense]|nr:hypothetical protein [Rhizobium skierniewicense]
MPLANVTNLQGSLDTKLNLTGGTITGGLQINGGFNSFADSSITKTYPAYKMHYPNVRIWSAMVRDDGHFYLRDDSGNGERFSVRNNGAVWTSQLGDLDGYINGRALAWANDRVANLSSRLVSRGTSGATLDFEGPSGTVVTGYQREGGGAGQVRFVYYRYLQMFDPVRGWIGTYYT